MKRVTETGVSVKKLIIRGGNFEIKEGATVATIEKPSEKTFQIYNVDGLKIFSKIVNDGNSFEDYTIELMADLDLQNEDWSPIGKSNTFDGVFDGKEHTISNIKYYTNESDWAVGLFACSNNATFKNFVISNVDFNIILTDDGDWGHIGAVVGYASGKTTIDNVTLTGDVKIISSEGKRGSGRIGGIVGGNYGEFDVKNIKINVESGSFVKGSSSIGGVAGQLQGKATFDTIESNIDVSANVFAAGGIVGIAPGETSFNKCSTSGNITVVAAATDNNLHRIGGIAGSWDDNLTNSLTLTECSYSGKLVSGEITEFDCGGYVGRGYSTQDGAKVIVNGVEYVYGNDN